MEKIKKREKNTERVEVEWRLLRAIADYYEFPVAVFLMNYGDFQKNG